MRFLEKNLEDIIYQADNASLKSRDLEIRGKKLRQVKIGNYGICDLITLKRCSDEYTKAILDQTKPFLEVGIYELKKEIVNIHTLLQACKYLKGIQSYMARRNFSFPIKYRIVLVGSCLDTTSDFIYLTDLIRSSEGVTDYDYSSFDLDFYTYEYDWDGIKFIHHFGYDLKNEGFE